MSKFWDWQRALLKHDSHADIVWAERLVGYATEGESIWVSAETVAEDYGVTKDVVRRARTRIVKAGWLVPTKRWHNGQRVLTISIPVTIKSETPLSHPLPAQERT